MPKLNFPESDRALNDLKKHLPGGVHYNFRYSAKESIPFIKANRSRLWDFDENEHLDLFCKFGALIVGHNNEEYKYRLIEYINKVMCVDQCDLEASVCERIVKHVPSAEMVRFGLSGTESIQNAIRLARAYTKKSKFVRFEGHFHGNSDNIMGGKQATRDRPVPIDYDGDLLGTEGRAPGIFEAQSFLIPWNDIHALEDLLEARGQEIGALIMEPICINGGGISPQAGYLEKVRNMCDLHKIILIFDEVITGFRVALGGAQSLLKVTPDITVFGKAMSGGALPVSAIVGKKEIMELYAHQKVIHGGTFNGYPLGLAAVSATIDILENDPYAYKRMDTYLQEIGDSLIEAASKRGIPMVVQGAPNVLVFHSQSQPMKHPGDYQDNSMFRDILIAKVSRDYGIQFSPISRFYSNLLLDANDVSFFKERIEEAMLEVSNVSQHFHYSH